MTINLRKYLWLFFKLYLLLYLAGIILLILLDNFLKIRITDFVVIIALCMTLPTQILEVFLKNEGRVFDDNERKLMIRKISRLAWVISMLIYIFCFTVCILVKFIFNSAEIIFILNEAHVSHNSFLGSVLLDVRVEYLIIGFVCISLIYYALINFLIRIGFKFAKYAVMKRNKKTYPSHDIE